MELPASLLSPPTSQTANSNAAGPSTSPAQANVSVSTLKKDAKKKHHLTTSTDPLLEELRDLNFSSVGKRLNAVARRLDEDYKVKIPSVLVCYGVWNPSCYRSIFSRRLLLNCVILSGSWAVCKRSIKPYDFVRAILRDLSQFKMGN